MTYLALVHALNEFDAETKGEGYSVHVHCRGGFLFTGTVYQPLATILKMNCPIGGTTHETTFIAIADIVAIQLQH